MQVEENRREKSRQGKQMGRSSEKRPRSQRVNAQNSHSWPYRLWVFVATDLFLTYHSTLILWPTENLSSSLGSVDREEPVVQHSVILESMPDALIIELLGCLWML